MNENDDLIERSINLIHKDGRAIDTDFGVAVRRVGMAMSKRGEPFEKAGVDLAYYLLSDRPLGSGERRELALMVLGDYRRSPRKIPLHPNHPDVLPIAKRYQELLDEGWNKDAAIYRIHQEFTITEKTVCNRLKVVFEREEAERKARLWTNKRVTTSAAAK